MILASFMAQFTPRARLARASAIGCEKRRHIGRHRRLAGRRASRTIWMSASSGCAWLARNARMRSRNASALSRACTIFISAMRWPSGIASNRLAASTSAGPSPVSSVNSRITPRFEIDACRRRCHSDPACRPENRSARHWRCAAPITPSRNAPSAERSAAMREAVAHRPVGKTPVAPGEEAREIGLRDTRRESTPSVDRCSPQQQHAAVPQLRLLGAQLREMRVDLGAALVRERPRARLEAQIEPLERNDRMSRSCRISSQARAPVKPRSCLRSRRPRRRRSPRRRACRRAIFSVSSIRLGRPIS